jgi:hypothetical protein
MGGKQQQNELFHHPKTYCIWCKKIAVQPRLGPKLDPTRTILHSAVGPIYILHEK